MANATEAPKPEEIGWLFVQQYYTMMNKKPGNLHLFYKSKSSFVHGVEGEQVKLSQGQQEIHDRISDLGLVDCKVLVSNVDSQGALEGGILVQVLGEISNDGQESRKFAQTFSLAPQETGFYVYNDIFRFLKEDVESEFGDEQHFEPNNAGKSSDVTTNGHNETLFSHNTAVAASAPAPATVAADKVSEAPEAKVSAPASKTVAEIEKAAEEPAHAPTELAQEVIASPTQTPVNAVDQNNQTSGTSEAVEAVAQAPVVEKEAEPAKPAAPLSWAARAAANAASKAQAAVSKAVAPKPVTQQKSSTPSEVERKPQTPNAAVADVTRSAFLKNISPKMTDDAIRAALKKFGDFKGVEINRTKSCGFVDYIDASSCAAAIKANKIPIGGEVMYVEERRRDVNGKIGPKEKRNDQNKDNRGDSRGARGGGRGGKVPRGGAAAK